MTIKIDKKIIRSEVLRQDPPNRSDAGDAEIIHMHENLARPDVLHGSTYKIKTPLSEHALYVTINDIETEGGDPGAPARRRPFEIFINTRNLEHYAWTVALTRMISAVFRRGGDVAFVAEELKAVFDPQGGRFMGGRYVPSLLAAIGDIIETHMRRIGFLPPASTAIASGDAPDGSADSGADGPAGSGGGNAPDRPQGARKVAGGRSCPRCGAAPLVKREGCWTCGICGFSRCG